MTDRRFGWIDTFDENARQIVNGVVDELLAQVELVDIMHIERATIDVCGSSDIADGHRFEAFRLNQRGECGLDFGFGFRIARSEERRVGKESSPV